MMEMLRDKLSKTPFFEFIESCDQVAEDKYIVAYTNLSISHAHLSIDKVKRVFIVKAILYDMSGDNVGYKVFKKENSQENAVISAIVNIICEDKSYKS